MYLNGSDSQETQDISGNGSELWYNVTYYPSEGSINRDPLSIIVPITLFYTIIFITGIVGNVSTCIVIFSNKYMHTATNFYLFSLAVSDLVLLLSALPKEVYELWYRYSYIFGEVTCILQGFASETAANATVLTITAFTVERYVAICHPFMSHTVSKLSRALRHIIIIWLVALCLAIPQAVQFGLEYSRNGVLCTVRSTVMDHAFEISSLLFFVIPMFTISALYVRIGLRLRNSRVIKMITPGNGSVVERQSTKNQTRVIRMLVAVVVAFIICWAPFHAQRLLAIYGKRSQASNNPSKIILELYYVLTYVSGVLYYLSATINPILYNIMSHRFRRAFKFTFGHLCSCCLSKQKRSKYNIKSRSYYAYRMNPHFQVSTPRSSLSQKEEIPLKSPYALSKKNSVERCQVNGNVPTIETSKSNSPSPNQNSDTNSDVTRESSGGAANNFLNAAAVTQNGKVLKKERSPIIALKNKLNALRPLPSLSKKKSRHRFYSMDDLSETKCTEVEMSHHSEDQMEKLVQV